jgi:cyanobactin maturation PatA/PatG family protease
MQSAMFNVTTNKENYEMNSLNPSANGNGQLVYAIGKIGSAYESDSKKDAMQQYAKQQDPTLDLMQPASLVKHLKAHPFTIDGIVWTLELDGTPIYAIKPENAYARLTGERLLALFERQISDASHLVSIPGIASGQVRLQSGQTVPTVDPGGAPIFSWTVDSLVKAVLGERPQITADQEQYDRRRAEISNFLQRVYYEVRNLGQNPQERAMNFAATTAYKLGDIFADAVRTDLALDRMEVEKSPFARPGSDCWDVKLTFFSPTKRLEQARKVYRFTIDVSTVAPVQIGDARSWYVY